MNWTLEEIERAAILMSWRQHNYDVLKAAKALGIGKTTMYRKLRIYGLKAEITHRLECEAASRQIAEFQRVLLEAQP